MNPHLQVGPHPNVYAVGDCAHTRQPKMAYHAGLHAAVAVGNITSSLSGRALSSYSPGEGSPPAPTHTHTRSTKLPALAWPCAVLLGNGVVLLGNGAVLLGNGVVLLGNVLCC